MDASTRAIRNGETDAPLLLKMHKKGVQLYDCADLHAKIILLDDVAIVGSGNMSSSSKNTLVEAALISDHGSVVAGVASLIEQLMEQSSQLKEKQIKHLCKIKVIRRGGRSGVHLKEKRKTRIAKLGNRTWIVGLYQLKKDPTPEEQQLIDNAKRSLQERLGGDDEDYFWIKWGVRGRFAQECRVGDLLIQIWRPDRARPPSAVFKAAPVLLKQPTKRWTRFYAQELSGRSQEMTWAQFQRLLRKVGHSRKVKPGSVQLIDADVADSISRQWNSAARGK